MFFDSHTHLDDSQFDADRKEVIENIISSGVSKLVNIGCNIKTSQISIDLAEKYDFIYATVGFHPCDTLNITDDDLKTIEDMTHHKKVVAIGEIGLDYHWDDVPRNTQKYWFEKQMELAERLNLPVTIHNRDAHEDILKIIQKYKNVKGIIHCCSASKEMVNEFLKCEYYISFAGPITYKNNSKSVESAKVVPMDRLLIETDAPYLSPDGFRGKRNDSSKVKYTCEKLAQIKGVTLEEMAKQTYENAIKIYKIKEMHNYENSYGR